MNVSDRRRPENVLLLAMSTLSRDYQDENWYAFKDDQGRFSCLLRGIGQLEAGTKFVLRKLAEENPPVGLDRIVVLCTKEALGDLSVVMEDYEDGSGGRVFRTSAYDFYEHRIRQYLKNVHTVPDYTSCLGEETVAALEAFLKERFPGDEIRNLGNELAPVQLNRLRSEFLREQKLDENRERNEERDWYLNSFIRQYLVKEGIGDLFGKLTDGSAVPKQNPDVSFISVPDLTLEKLDFQTIIHHILGERFQDSTEIGNGIRLFVDTQGSVRTMQLMMNSVIHILGSRGLVAEEFLAISFNSKNLVNEIQDVTKSTLIIDLAVGMNEFLSTGRSDRLKVYFEKYRRLDVHAGTAEASIMDAINEISDAILLNQVKPFESGLDHLAQVLSGYRARGEGDQVFQTFVNDLSRDYERYHLLDPEKRSLVSEISWCRSKMLIQQAVTLLEAETPGFLFREGILYCPDPDKAIECLIDWADVIHAQDYMVSDAYHFMIFNVLNELETKARCGILFDKDQRETTISPKPIKRKCQVERTPKSLYLRTICGSPEKVVEVLAAYNTLSTYRNKINHALHGEGLTREKLKEIVDDLMKNLEAVMEDRIDTEKESANACRFSQEQEDRLRNWKKYKK